MRARRLIREERGTTLAELVVGMGAGAVVLLGLTTLIVVSLHTTTRVSARVDATQRARMALTQTLDQLHSACIAPKISPIRKGSTGTSLAFVHAAGSAVAPTPVLTVISLSGTTLSQSDYAYKSGNPPFWTFEEAKPASTRQLMTKVSAISGTPVFSYYASLNGAISGTPLTAPLGEFDASRAIHVNVAFQTEPMGTAPAEEGTSTYIKGGATLRLTTPSYNKEAPSMPCQ
jgi:hypothetical protein